DGELYPSLAAEAVRLASAAASYDYKSSGASKIPGFGEQTGIVAVRLGQPIVPTDADGTVRLYDSGHQPQRFIPAWQILDGDFDADAISGHIVLIGTSAAAIKDLRSTPLEPVMAGVEIHAQLIENILAGASLTRPAYVIGMELAITAFGGLVLIGLVPLLAARWTAGLHLAATALLMGASLYAFQQLSFLLDWSYPVLSGTAVYLLLVYAKYATTERQKKQVSTIFRQYLSPILVEQLVRQPTPPRLGGELRTMTVMFADVRNFTSISERLKDVPQALTGLINRFLTPMTDAVLAQNGTIDKYVGDSLMAFWNAPLNVEGHAARACAAALAMFQALERLNQALQAEAAPSPAVSLSAAAAPAPTLALGMGVGLSTGECVVGNMGSAHRFNYSVLGDTVNLAARLESLTKLYGVE
ncbi:MAG: adenylate/guanylate cyclase domain-containing protein, partial [Dongiaceae bacterium]